MKKKHKIFYPLLAAIILFIAAYTAVNLNIVYAATPIGGQDGAYSVKYDIGGQSGTGASMIAKYFDSTVAVEKIGENYYASVTQLSTSMENLTLTIEDGKQVGYEITENSGGRKTYRYTLSAENLAKPLPFSVYVTARKETFTFTLSLDLANAARTGDVTDTTADRPAEFVPVIATEAASEYEVAQGSTFVIPTATAALGEKNCEVTYSAYYIQNGEKTAVEINQNNAFTLTNAGEYQVTYRAESTAYKTLNGNNSFAEKTFTVTSVVGQGSLAKVEDTNNALNGASVLASRITSGSTVYETAAERMKTIADNFEVFGVEYIASDGTSVTPSGKITLKLKAKSTFNRNEIVVYHMDENGDLTKLESSNGGSFVKVTTDKFGTFIVCVPGVAFVMPIWGYILIVVAAVVVIAAAVTVTIILVRRKKKANKAKE